MFVLISLQVPLFYLCCSCAVLDFILLAHFMGMDITFVVDVVFFTLFHF